MKTFLTTLLCLIILNAFSQNRPFPYPQTYTTGSIKPTNYTSTQLNTQVKSIYDSWKAAYFVNGCASGQAYIDYGLSGYATVSEAMGYGMLISVYMAGYDASAKTNFDKLWAYVKAHPSGLNTKLLAWRQQTDCSTDQANDDNSATDGDIDIAYALLCADVQWGSAGTINYLQEAKTILTALMSSAGSGCINNTTWVVKLGDWATYWDQAAANQTRPSDFITYGFTAFANSTGNTNWTNVNTKCYSIIDHIQTSHSATTGLVPDFVVNANTNNGDPAAANFLEGPEDGKYGPNACRVPWRLALDYLLYGEVKAKTALDKINTWLKTASGNNANSVWPGYSLSGTPSSTQYQSPAFVGPFAVGAMVNNTNQTWLNALYANLYNQSFADNGYYENSIKLMCMIALSGNWWKPESGTVTNYTLTTNATNGIITKSPNATDYASGTVVTLTATPNSGYQFDGWSGDATGTTNPVTVTMTTNKTVTATFSLIGTTTYTLTINATNGTVAKNPNKASYNSGETVTLTATPNTGYSFTSWSGDATGTTNPVTITMSANKTVTATFTAVQTCTVFSDLLKQGVWLTGKDALGSTITPTVPALVNNEINVSWSTVKDATWGSWVSLESHTPDYLTNFKGMTSIKITYKSSKDFLVSLPQYPLYLDGGSYTKAIPTATTWSTVELITADFAMPSWYLTDGLYPTTPLILDSIRSIAFGPDVDVSTAAFSGTIDIKELKVCDVELIVTTGSNIADVENKINFKNNSLLINSTTNSNYIINLYSIEGKLVYSESIDLHSGTNTIPLTNVQNGLYVIRLTNENTNYSTKLLISK